MSAAPDTDSGPSRKPARAMKRSINPEGPLKGDPALLGGVLSSSSGNLLFLKRFPSGLTPGACRSRVSYPHDAVASYAPTGSALCRVCNTKIQRGSPRVAMFLQCHLGYKDPSMTHYLHLPCLHKYPEAHKLADVSEVHAASCFSPADAATLASELALAHPAAPPKVETGGEGAVKDEEEAVTDAAPAAPKRKKPARARLG